MEYLTPKWGNGESKFPPGDLSGNVVLRRHAPFDSFTHSQDEVRIGSCFPGEIISQALSRGMTPNDSLVSGTGPKARTGTRQVVGRVLLSLTHPTAVVRRKNDVANSTDSQFCGINK